MNSTILAPMRRDAALKAEIRRIQEPPTIEGKTQPYRRTQGPLRCTRAVQSLHRP